MAIFLQRHGEEKKLILRIDVTTAENVKVWFFSPKINSFFSNFL
jgi:hypothetical protein